MNGPSSRLLKFVTALDALIAVNVLERPAAPWSDPNRDRTIAAAKAMIDGSLAATPRKAGRVLELRVLMTSLGRRFRFMLRRALASSRYVVFIAAVATLVASIALILYEAIVVVEVVFKAIREGGILPVAGKTLAVGLIGAVDVFLIAIVALIIGLGLYALFVDDALPLPRWLNIHDLEDLKEHLVRIVIAVLAVLFLREAVDRAADTDLLRLAAALALIVATLTFFLSTNGTRKE